MSRSIFIDLERQLPRLSASFQWTDDHVARGAAIAIGSTKLSEDHHRDHRSVALFASLAAFGTYFCMYAFRKPFTAGTFEDSEFWGIGFKSILITAQLAGYTLSKFLGIAWVSAWSPNRRAIGVLGLIAIAELALLGFAVSPPLLGAFFLFLNGLPLGMVFGLVLSFMEGRRMTEAMTAGLCISFIVSSGIVKSVGRWLIMQWGVSEYWMPAVVGALFTPPLLISVALLSRVPPPDPEDVRLRHLRTPMNRRDRGRLMSRHRDGLMLLITVFVLLTVIRSVRDDFAVEIWRGLGYSDQPSIFAWSELAVMFGVLIVNGAAVRIRENRRALDWSLALVAGGLAVVLAAIAGFTAGWLSPFPFMVLIGTGMYVPYVAYHTTVFERLMATFREPGNIAFLMYLADSAGYLGYVGFLLTKPLISADADPLGLFVRSTTVIAILAFGLSLAAIVYYRRRLRFAVDRCPEPETSSQVP